MTNPIPLVAQQGEHYTCIPGTNFNQMTRKNVIAKIIGSAIRVSTDTFNIKEFGPNAPDLHMRES